MLYRYTCIYYTDSQPCLSLKPRLLHTRLHTHDVLIHLLTELGELLGDHGAHVAHLQLLEARELSANRLTHLRQDETSPRVR